MPSKPYSTEPAILYEESILLAIEQYQLRGVLAMVDREDYDEVGAF